MTISKAFAALSAIALAIVAYRVLPHADLPHYGKFADDQLSTSRNVWSNAGLLIVGFAGVWWAVRSRRVLADDFAAALALFGGVIATAFGSAYFHADPLAGGDLNRFTLLWDRLPMVIAFAGLIALVLRDRVFHRANRIVLPLLALFGVAATLYWYWSGDLYPYAFFQFYAAAGTLLMVMALRGAYTESGYVVAAVFLFGIAKLFEDLDWELFRRWGVGGHPLKHVAAAIAASMILLWLGKRRARA